MANTEARSDLGAYILRQAENNRWSNHRLLTACSALSEEEYFERRPSFFGSIHAHLDHIVLVDWLYLERLTGEALLPEAFGDTLHQDLDALKADQAAADRALIAYCRATDGDALFSTVSYRTMDGTPFTERVVDVLAHLFTHQIHHRGQVHDMLSATSVAPPQLDEFFLETDLPLREKELRDLDSPMD